MALQASLHRSLTVNKDTFSILHQLMYLPGGVMRFGELRRTLASGLSNDVKRVAIHCHQCAYVDFNGELIQLTEQGLQFYLDQKRNFLGNCGEK